MLDHKALNAALIDLAQYGWVILETLEDARQVRKAVPYRTKLIVIKDTGGAPMYKVELVPDLPGRHRGTSKRTAAARAIASHILSLLFLTAVGVGIAWLLLWLMRIV